MNKLFAKIAAFSAGLALAIGVGVSLGHKEFQAAEADTLYTLTQVKNTKNSSYSTAYNVTINGMGWEVYANMNFDTCWRVGGKNLSSVERTFTSKSAITGTVGSVTVNHSGTSRNEVTLNAADLDVASDSGFTSIVESVHLTPSVSKSVSGSFTFEATSTWTNCYYRLTFTVSNSSADNNGGLDFVSAVFDEPDSGGPYHVTYNGNGATSGSMSDPTDYDSGDLVTIMACGFMKDGYEVTGWNTAADGSGTSYGLSAQFNITKNTTLYAQWSAIPGATITLNSSNWPVTATATHDDEQTAVLDGVTYSNVRGYIYSSKLSLNYKVNAYFGNKTAFSKNIDKIVVTYTDNVTSYVKMYEGDEPLKKGTLVSSSGTTTVTYTFSNSNPYFRLNMDTSTPKGTYCNITSIVITLGSAAEEVDMTDFDLNDSLSMPEGYHYQSIWTPIPSNANAKNTIAWESSNTSVATVDSTGLVTAVSAGTTTITATATDLVNIHHSYIFTVFEANPIEALYYARHPSDRAVFNAVYVGFSAGNGPIVMNGQWGVMIYGSSIDVSSWVEGETILGVTDGTIDFFNGLCEVKNAVYTLNPAVEVAAPVVHATTGSETAMEANRLTNATGRVTAVTKGSLASDPKTSDIEMTYQVGSNSFKVFYKSAAQTTEINAALLDSLTNGTEITIKGFTSWYNGFQVQMNGIVEAVESYTAEDFAQDLLDQTDAVCAGWEEGDNNHDAIEAIWSDLADVDKYPSLPADQKAILASAERDEHGTVVEQAMARYDFLTGKYDLSNFINGRTPISSRTNFEPFSFNNGNNGVAIIIIAIASISAISLLAVLIIKKRKQR